MAEEHEKLSRKLEQEAAELEEKGDAVDQHVKEARDDWRRKVADAAVPGAVPPSDEEEAALGAGEPDEPGEAEEHLPGGAP